MQTSFAMAVSFSGKYITKDAMLVDLLTFYLLSYASLGLIFFYEYAMILVLLPKVHRIR